MTVITPAEAQALSTLQMPPEPGTPLPSFSLKGDKGEPGPHPLLLTGKTGGTVGNICIPSPGNPSVLIDAANTMKAELEGGAPLYYRYSATEVYVPGGIAPGDFAAADVGKLVALGDTGGTSNLIFYPRGARPASLAPNETRAFVPCGVVESQTQLRFVEARSLPLPVPVAPTISARITFSAQGADLQWPAAYETGVQGYHIERNHELGVPEWGWTRLTAVPQTGLTFRNLWAWEGEAISYRVLAVLANGTEVAHVTLSGTQSAFSANPRTTQLVIDDSNTVAGAETVFEGYVFDTGERVDCIRVNTKNKVRIRKNKGRTSGNFCSTNGNANVVLEDNYAYGKVPTTKNYAVGQFFVGDYGSTHSERRNLVRAMGGTSLGQWRGKKAAEGGAVTTGYGNIYWDLARKRSNGVGGDLSNDTIVSKHKESSTRGQSNPNDTDGYTMPIGHDFAQLLNLNGNNNADENLPGQFFGGLDWAGIFVYSTHMKSLMEDQFNFYLIGGESLDVRVKLRGYFTFGNPGNGISNTGQRWQPGMPFNMGGQRQPTGSYIPGAPKPAGDYSFPYQSMTGGLPADEKHLTRYANTGAFTLIEDFWLVGPGTQLGAQHGNNHQLNRGKVIFTGKLRDGTPLTGDPRIGVYMSGDAGFTVEGKAVSHSLGISNVHTIKPTNLNTQPQGFGEEWTTKALTFGNTCENRLATAAEERAAHHQFLLWCHNAGIQMGPNYGTPEVVYD
ncbi:hypothetical protein [Deinococcus sp. QL22]|uniref:hypothetical protein n=1 Tax=Deinococcus sp. QL22 TaxID=2939437 RepID=UPI00201710D7|nr:hypothetical protein [Deinococcus sp. QL22]UQN10353.1 hypothetical protein M1R55_29825 [Deinococcus sp. QL22]UQN10487.1 hypothetical protein M1R55_29150 [Deinococcus sp. QL22]